MTETMTRPRHPMTGVCHARAKAAPKPRQSHDNHDTEASPLKGGGRLPPDDMGQGRNLMIGPSPRLPEHLSVSAVQTYARCPRAWERRYVDGQAEPPSAPMSFGKAFAVALEAHHRGQDADDAFVKAHAESGNAYPGAEHGLRLLELYRQRYDLDGVPEQEFRLHLPDRKQVPVPILGYMDLERADEVVEFKTSRNPWTQARADAEYQSAVYGWAFRERHGRRPERVRYLVFSTRTVDVQEISTQPTGSDLRLFELAAIVAWRGIVAGKFDGCGKCVVCKPPVAEYAWHLPRAAVNA